MAACPILGRVPGQTQDELLIKATLTGVTYLTQRKYRARYRGSKSAAVSINGKLYKKKAELQAAIDSWKEPQKKRAKSPDPAPKFSDVAMQSNNNVLTDNLYLPTTGEKISPPIRAYRIKKSEVRHRILGYINTQKGKKELYFWTVSFFQGTPDKVAYQIFNIWLTSLRKYRMLREYLWIAERQENGTIHFHIAIPHKMPVHRANAMMAGTLKTFARRGLIPASVHECRRYNGVDIAKNRKTRRVTNFAVKKGSRALSTYLTKYVTKNSATFEHLAWHNSRGYSALFTSITFTVAEFRQHRFGFFINRTRILTSEYAKFIPWLDDPPPLLQDHLYRLNTYLQLSPN